MATMEFWGVEVKAKEPNKVTLDEGSLIHLSQATLGELKKDNESVIIHVKVDDKKFVLGVLNQATPQLSFDLVFEQEFEISHNAKKGSVHFLGYSTSMPDDGPMDLSMFSDDSDASDEEPLPVLRKENGISAAPAQAAAAKPEVAAKPAKDNKPKPQEKDDSDEDDSDSDSYPIDTDSDAVDDSNEDLMGKSDEDSDDDEDDEDDESEDEKPVKPQSGKKRPNADAKTPEAKKVKLVTPQKTDGKKGVHTATPHPSKKVAKTSGGDKSTPKSGGQFSCEPCKKSFNSDNALQSHNKAKHAAK